MGRASGPRACRSGGWVCGAGWAMCSCEGRVCVGMAWGVSRGGKAHATRVPLRPSGAASSPTPRAWATTVCAPHSPAQAVGCAAREAGAGSGARERREPARDVTWAAVGHRMCSAVCVRPPGWRRARLGAKEMRVAAQPQVWRAGALPADEKSRNWSSRAGRPGEEPGACVSTGARVPRAGASAARRTRPVKKEKKAAARRAPTAEEAHRMHARNPRSSKRHAAPRARAGGHATRSSDCGCPAGSG